MTSLRFLVQVSVICWVTGVAGWAQSQPDYELPPIEYSTRAPNDEFAGLRKKLASGDVVLRGEERQVLRDLLRHLRVPESSQVLVFSRTSLQRGRIRPERPRALYFSDTVYVGWVPGGLFEVAAIDPVLGPVFYSISVRSAPNAVPQVDRDPDCLRCHGGTFVRDIPGVFVRSVFPDSEGEPLHRHGTQIVEDDTPFAERWGGWYVTGYHGREPHRGNVLASETDGRLVFAPESRRPDELSDYFSTAPYLRKTSDVVALLVLEHQLTVQNTLTRAGLTARRMIAYQHGLQKAFKEALTDEPTYESVKNVIASTVQDVVDHLLFRDAAPLPEGIVGHDFRERFQHDAVRDAAGQSLKDLHLDGRLFKNRCSYLIYSPGFRELPEILKVRVLDRLRDELLSRDPKGRYAYLPDAEKQRIFDVLRGTHPDARQRWAPSQLTGAVGQSVR